MHKLDDDRLIDNLRGMGGTHAKVIEDRELMDYFLPRLSADLEVNENYRYDGHRIGCPCSRSEGAATPSSTWVGSRGGN